MRRRLMIQRLLLTALLLSATCLAGPAWAALAEVSTAELIHRSSDVVRAEVLSIESAWNEPKDFILTTVTLRVTEVYKGTVEASSTVDVIVPGGEVDGIGLGVEHAPQFEIGQNVIVLLRPTDEPVFAVVGWEMGKFTVHEDHVVEKGVSLEEFRTEIRRVVDEETDAERGE